MAKQIINKTIAIILVLVMTMSNWILIGTTTYAAYEELEEQRRASSEKNVSFDTYYYIGENKVHSATLDAVNESMINFEVNVKEGFIKDATINLENANFEIIGIDSQSEENIVNTYESSKIILNQINSNTNIIVTAKIKANHEETVDSDFLGRETIAYFEGNYTNIKGKEKQINSNIVIRTDWSANNVEASIDENVNKVLNENGKIIVETLLTSKINDNVLPIKSSKIDVNVPKIGDELPEDVRVTAKSTSATNGDNNGNNFGKDNYSYNKDEGTLEININNDINDENKYSWKKGEDTLYISYIYSNINELTQIELKSKNTITTYNDINLEKESEKIVQLELNGTNVDYLMSSTDKITKGNIYANSLYETDYKSIINARITYVDSVSNLTFNINNDNYVDENEEKSPTNTYYKSTVINKSNFEKILGEDGNIQLLNNGNLLTEFNKETQIDENGNFVFNYPDTNVQNITITTSKPISEGILIIENNKTLTATSTYTFEQLKTFKIIEGNVNGVISNTNLEETSSKAEIQLSSPNLSTVVTNENFEIRAILKSTEDKDDLYKNPTLEITLPEEVQNIEITSANILFTDELQISEISVIDNRIIKISLQGEQTSYIEKANEGITVIVNGNITLDKYATTRNTECILNFTNEKAVSLDKDGKISKELNIVAPTGVITSNTVSNTKTGEQATSFRDETEEANLEMNVSKVIATYKETIINNESETINNLKIYGKIPTKGDELGSTIDTKFASEVRLLEEKNYTVYYSSEENIDIASVKNNETRKVSSRSAVRVAEVNIENNSSEWTTELKEDSKSYIIEINESVNQGETLTVTYDAQIPENLSYNENIVSEYKVTYTTQAEEPTTTSSPIVAMSTEAGAELEGTLTSNSKVSELGVGETVKYTLEVKNTGTIKAENVTANIDVPNGMKYIIIKDSDDNIKEDEEGNIIEDETENNEDEDIEYGTTVIEKEDRNISFNLGDLEPNETNTVEFIFKAVEIVGDVEVQAKLTCDNNAMEYESNKLTNKISYKKDILIESNIVGETEDGTKSILVNDEIILSYNVSNISGNDIKNMETIINIPEGLEFLKAENADGVMNETIEYDSNNRKLSIKLKDTFESITEGTTVFNEYRIYLKPLVANKELICTGEVTGNNIEKVSFELETIIAKSIKDLDVQFDATATIESGYISKQTGNINYTITLANNSDENLEDIYLYVTLPDELVYKKLYIDGERYSYELMDIRSQLTQADDDDDSESTEEKELVVDTKNLKILISEFNPGKSTEIEIETKVEYDYVLQENKNLNTHIEIGNEWYEKDFNYILTELDDDEDDSGSNSNQNNLYAISGGAWLDTNRNGAMESSEQKLSGITVKAIDASTGEIAQNNGSDISATTDENGRYILNYLSEGKYFVIFEYDSDKYSVTAYKKTGVDESINSNVIESSYSGKKVAKTNDIEIENNNIANVNIGLIEGATFDLSLNKKVTKISSINNKKTTTKNYNTQLAKIDLEYKNIEKTKVVVEYTITVINEGNIPGTATKIVDYIPKEFDFSTELNKDWYTSSEGIETKTLANEMINPGESKQIKLILTKNMTEDGNGIINNTAEIAEAYNELGKEDVDSTPGNNQSGEDDISSANVILGLRTGGPITYITLTITIMAIICVGAYEINKRVLKNK